MGIEALRYRPIRGALRRAALGVLLLLGLACWPLPGAAEEDLGPPGSRIRQALEAAARQDAPALRALAEDPEVDPWPLAHELCLRGEFETARGLARASERPELRGLETYVRFLQRRRPDARAWGWRERALTMVRDEKWYDLVAWLEEERIDPSAPVVPSVEILHAKGIALLRLDQAAEGADALWQAATLGEGFGWLKMAVRSLHDCGAVAYETLDWRRLLACQEALLRIHGLTGNRQGTALALSNLGTVQGSLGDLRRAVEYFERVLEEYADALGDGARSQILSNVALAYAHLGDLAEAQAAATRARERAERAGDHRMLALAWQTLGMVHAEIGNAVEARAWYERAMAYYVEVQDDVERAAVLGNLGNLEVDAGAYEAALALLEEALRIFVEHEDVTFALRARTNIAIVHARQGDVPRALRELAGLRRRYEEMQDPRGLHDVLDQIALLLRREGEIQRALAHRHLALARAREMGSVASEAHSLVELAWLEVERDRFAAGLAHARDAVQLLGLLFDRLPASQAVRARDHTAGAYEAGLAAAVGLGDADEACFFLEGGRAGALLVALEGRSLIRRAHVSAALREEEAVARTAEALARLEYLEAQRGGRLDSLRAARRELERARTALQAAVERVQLEAGRSADLLYPSPAGREEIQVALHEGEALVLYGESRDEIVAVVVTPERASLHRLGPVATLQEACASVRIGPETRDAVPDFDPIRRLVVEPLGLPDDVERVLVSPSGCLSYQPAALLFPEREVACVPSGTAYLRMQEHSPDPTGRVLALGDPEYGTLPVAASREVALRSNRFVPLPHTREEARAVGDVVLLGAEASETNLRRQLATEETWRAVHLACHGVVDEARPSFSTLVLSPTPEDDGLLTALDVFQIRCRASLVVLSACDTGRGPLQRAEGIIGLTRSFISAGASSVLVSLWQVEDEASGELMVKFHSLWNHPDPQRRLGAAAALRAAQEHVRSRPRWAHPYYWAAWQLWGQAD